MPGYVADDTDFNNERHTVVVVVAVVRGRLCMKAASKEDSLPVWQRTQARGTHLTVAGTVCLPLLHKLGAATPQSYLHLLPFCDSICSALALLSQRRLNYLFMQIEAVKSKLQQQQHSGSKKCSLGRGQFIVAYFYGQRQVLMAQLALPI